MGSKTIFWAGWRKLKAVCAHLPLRVKGMIVVAIPLAAMLESTVAFYLIQRADRQEINLVRRSSQFVETVGTGLADLSEGEAVVNQYLITPGKERLARLVSVNHALGVDLARLESLLRNEPSQLERLRRVRSLVQDETRAWLEMSAATGSAPRVSLPSNSSFERSAAEMDTLRAQLYIMRGEQQKLLTTRVKTVAEFRRWARGPVAGDALFGLGGGVLAIWLFTSGVTRGVNRFAQYAAPLKEGLPTLASNPSGKAIAGLEGALQEASVNLLKSEEERDRFFALSLDMLCVFDLDGHFKRVNPAFTRTLGHSETVLLGRNILDFVHPDDREATDVQLKELARGNSMTYFENRLSCADGSYKWIVWSSAPVLDDGMAIAVARDNTKQKLAEHDLRRSNARLSWVLESTTDAFFAMDSGWHFSYVNPEAERLLRRSSAELLGRNIYEVLPAAEKFLSRFEQAELAGVAIHFEELYSPFEQWWEVHAYPSTEGLSVYFRDVTKRRQDDERIRRALLEKEVLLREIHHRVKNNLQVVCSMLRLKAGHVRDERLSEVLRECRERVQVMALLHDQLHRAKDLSSIDMSEYIRNLVASLFSSYGVNSARIGLVMDVETIPVSMDTAIPCGLIVHELVSNSLRHAFPGDAKGQVSVGLHVDADGQMEVTVSDNGIGISKAGSQSDTRSLGLQLVYLLTEQLEASVECSGKNGTHHRLVFKPKISKENETNEQVSHLVGRG